MNHQTKRNITSVLTSFIGMGIFIVLFVIGLAFFSYLLIIGGIIGLILFGIAYIRTKFFIHKVNKHAEAEQKQQHHGRTIDQGKK